MKEKHLITSRSIGFVVSLSVLVVSLGVPMSRSQTQKIQKSSKGEVKRLNVLDRVSEPRTISIGNLHNDLLKDLSGFREK